VNNVDGNDDELRSEPHGRRWVRGVAKLLLQVTLAQLIAWTLRRWWG